MSEKSKSKIERKLERKIKFYYIFCLIQDDMLTFFSGIFVSVALNILTSNLPESILKLGTTHLLLTVMMLIASYIFIRWAIVVKPILASFSAQDVIRKKMGDAVCWYELLAHTENVKNKLVIYLFSEVFLSVICGFLLVCPNGLSVICQWISDYFSQCDVPSETTALAFSISSLLGRS